MTSNSIKVKDFFMMVSNVFFYVGETVAKQRNEELGFAPRHIFRI